MSGYFKGKKNKDIEWGPETIIDNSFILNNISNKLYEASIKSVSNVNENENFESFLEKQK